jgi:hypothetical protein
MPKASKKLTLHQETLRLLTGTADVDGIEASFTIVTGTVSLIQVCTHSCGCPTGTGG